MSDAPKPEPTEAQRFLALARQVIAVPKGEILKREREVKEQRKQARKKAA